MTLSTPLALALASTLAAGADAPPPSLPAAEGTVIVTLADGSTVPLRGWTLSYEYALYGRGVSPVMAPLARHNTTDLYLGKDVVPASLLSTLEVTYQPVGSLTLPRSLTVTTTGGKPRKEKVEPPDEDLVVQEVEKGKRVMVRTLDLRGETLTGTRRDFCVVSYTAIVQCGTTAEDRVVKLQFQR